MRRKDFGKSISTPANSTTEGPVFGEKLQYPAIGPELSGTPGKQHAAGQKARQRVMRQRNVATAGGHRDVIDNHAPAAKNPYKVDGDDPIKGPAHSAGARPVK